MKRETCTVIIWEHKYPGSSEIISGVPKGKASEFVERWQKASIHYQVHGTLPPITWKVAEKPGLVDALIESTKRP